MIQIQNRMSNTKLQFTNVSIIYEIINWILVDFGFRSVLYQMLRLLWRKSTLLMKQMHNEVYILHMGSHLCTYQTL